MCNYRAVGEPYRVLDSVEHVDHGNNRFILSPELILTIKQRLF
jgi:hypothetical protein